VHHVEHIGRKNGGAEMAAFFQVLADRVVGIGTRALYLLIYDGKRVGPATAHHAVGQTIGMTENRDLYFSLASTRANSHYAHPRLDAADRHCTIGEGCCPRC
jgi:hypothetical protein